MQHNLLAKQQQCSIRETSSCKHVISQFAIVLCLLLKTPFQILYNRPVFYHWNNFFLITTFLVLLIVFFCSIEKIQSQKLKKKQTLFTEQDSI